MQLFIRAVTSIYEEPTIASGSHLSKKTLQAVYWNHLGHVRATAVCTVPTIRTGLSPK